MKRLLLIALLAAVVFDGCGNAEPETDLGRVVAVVPGESDPGAAGQTETTIGVSTTKSVAGRCPIDEVCEIEVPLEAIELEATPSSIFLDGDRAWLAAPDAQALIEVDTVAAAVVQTLAIEAPTVDVVSGMGSLWAVTYDISFGPLLRIDPTDGTVTATIDTFADQPQAVAALDNSLWAVVDGYGRAIRIDAGSNAITDTVGGTDYGGGRGEVAVVADGAALWVLDESTGSVERIDDATRTIALTVGDLGYLEEPDGEFVSILADGPKALAATGEGIWVLSDVPYPDGLANAVGGGALFLLDAETGTVLNRIDLILEPAFGRPGLAVSNGAAWYIDSATGYPVRVDLDTERQVILRLDNGGVSGVVTDGTMTWFAVESLFDSDLLVGVAESAAVAASSALDE